MLAILISNRRTAISWGFFGGSCNQLITHHRFNKLPTNKNPPTHSLLAVQRNYTQIKIQYDKTMSFHLFNSKVPNLFREKQQKKHWKVHAFHGDIESSWNQHRSNRHQVGFQVSSIESGGCFSLAQPTLLEQYHMKHVDEFHEPLRVGKIHTK